MFQVNSPNDQSRTASTFLAIDFLFSTNDLGGALGEISEREENTLPFRVVNRQGGGGGRGEQGCVGRKSCRLSSEAVGGVAEPRS